MLLKAYSLELPWPGSDPDPDVVVVHRLLHPLLLLEGQASNLLLPLPLTLTLLTTKKYQIIFNEAASEAELERAKARARRPGLNAGPTVHKP